MPPRSINDNDFILLFTEKVHTLLGNTYWIFFILVSKEGTLNLGRIHL